MIVDIVRPPDLSDEQVRRWDQLQQQSENLASPFLSAAFTQAVGRHRSDVEVAILQAGGEVVGFFPFQRDKGSVGWPVGYRLNDFQAGVFAPQLVLDARELLRYCGLTRWHFDHLMADQSWLRACHTNVSESPYVDMSAGFAAYVAAQQLKSRVQQITRKSRVIAREMGPVRFEFRSCDRTVFTSLLAWKSQQIQAWRARNVLAWDWVLALLDDLRQSQSSACHGVLSALYAGDRLVAAHFGICNHRTLHWWFSAYDPACGRYSPGIILLLRLIESAAQEGIPRLDLGKGDESYKTRLQSGTVSVAEGAVTRTAWSGMMQRASYRLRAKLRSGALQKPTRSMKRLFERFVAPTKG